MTKAARARLLVSFIAMEDVSEGGHLLRHRERKRGEIGSGFTAFRDNDVLVAKITPCFENGKGAHAEGLINGFAFGSTEFHVIRAHDPQDARFIYHIIMDTAFRRDGERYMTGSAGQRRIPAEFIEDYRITIMPQSEKKWLYASLISLSRKLANLPRSADSLSNKNAVLRISYSAVNSSWSVGAFRMIKKPVQKLTIRLLKAGKVPDQAVRDGTKLDLWPVTEGAKIAFGTTGGSTPKWAKFPYLTDEQKRELRNMAA
jgi:hypothetical protein